MATTTIDPHKVCVECRVKRARRVQPKSTLDIENVRLWCSAKCERAWRAKYESDHGMVYVLFHETNTGHFDESDGYVEAVFKRMSDAEANRLALIRAAVENGEDAYYDPDTEEENAMWDRDWRVEIHQLR